MTATIAIRLLGPFEVLRDGEPVAVGGPRRRAVLAILALEHGRVVPVSRLVEGVWGEEPPDTAVTALHGHVSHLRRALGAVVVTRAPGYLLDVPPDAVDVASLEALTEEARTELAAGRHDCARTLLAEAVALTRGEPLADLADAPFAAAVLPALEERVLAVREEDAEARLAAGEPEQAVAPLKALVAEHPLRERPRRQLMLALHRSGRQAEALAVYDAARRLLADELGLEPGDALRQVHDEILLDDPSPRRSAPPQRAPAGPVPAGGRGRVVVAAVAALAVAAALVASLATRGSDAERVRAPRALHGPGVLRIDPDRLRVVGATPSTGTPQSVVAAGDGAYVIDGDDQTVTELAADGRRMRTFATGATPIDLGGDGRDVWVVDGRVGRGQFLGARPTGVLRVSRGAADEASRVRLPAGDGAGPQNTSDRVAETPGAVWAIAGDGAVVRIDPVRGAVVSRLPLRAVALAAAGRRVWVLTADGSLVPVDEGTSVTGAPIDVGTAGGSVAVGGGAVWVSDPNAGAVIRIEPSAPGRRRTARIGAGSGAVVFGAGAAWVADRAAGRVVRLDAATAAVTGAVDVHGTPRDLAAARGAVWATVTPATTTGSATCGGVIGPGGPVDRLLVAELPLRRGSRSPTGAMAGAIRRTLERAGFRAGRFRVGLRLCDDALAQSATWDPEKCAANARAQVADRRVVALVGPYTSGCAARQLPITTTAPSGPLAVVSPTASDPFLTRDAPPGRFGFARVIARDDRQARALMDELRRRGARTVAVLDDGGWGLAGAGHAAAAAHAVGLRVVRRASWTRPTAVTVADAVARADPDAVVVSGLLDEGAGGVVRALRQALPPRALVAGNDGLLPVRDLVGRAGAAARGVLLATGAPPARRPGVHPYVPLAEQATEAALDAIARSDGSRRSVAAALRSGGRFDARGDLRRAPVAIFRVARGGGSGQLASPDGADLVAVRR